MWDWLISLIQKYLEGVVLWNPSAADIATVVSVAAVLMGAVQGIKRALEWLEGQDWLSKVPVLAKLVAWLAHGWGPRVLAALVAVATMAPTAVQDGSLTGAEGLNIIVAILVALGLYEVVRGRFAIFFPKRDG